MAFKKGNVDYEDVVSNTKQTRKVKYFVQFENKTIQPQNIERIEQDEVANEHSFGGDGDCLIYRIIVRTRDYPFTMFFSFLSEEERADALTLLHSQMTDNRVQVQ